MTQRKILITAALPYANGDIHIGHLVEYLQADIWSRFQKMRGHECLYLCADDTHGTPIMISAKKKGISPEQMIEDCHKQHLKDFTDFDINFDAFHSSNSEESKKTVEEIFHKIESKGLVTVKPVQQPYCENDKMFLPDRFVVGVCPKCKAENQYGDSCDSCGSTYSPNELIGAQCSVCGTTPVQKSSDHVFYQLEPSREFLTQWVNEHTNPGVAKKLMEWLEGELKDWDISRDAPYFGFEIPGHPKKYFYVWADAPVGYIGTTKYWCKQNNRDYREFWSPESVGKTELYHFIGKDIVYQHALFWPFMLKNAELRTPDQIFVHGMLSVNGEKMSKSKGTFINARTYLNHADPSHLRYYFATKLSSGMDDFDLNMDDFVSRVNSDLIGKITNLASRGGQMLGKSLNSKMGTLSEEGLHLVQLCQSKSELIASYYENREYAKAMIEIRQLADESNRYFDELEPWKLLKVDPEKTREVLTAILNAYRIMAVYLKPVLPSYVAKVEVLFNSAPFTWSDTQTVLTNYSISNYKHLSVRLEKKQLDAIVTEEQAHQKKLASTTGNTLKSQKNNSTSETSIADTITYDDFIKIDLRVAEILTAEIIPKANKLLKLTVGLGEYGEREIIAGIKAAYDPKDLIGRKTVVVANLAPRKMKFGVSEGMVLAAGDGGTDLYILAPDDGSKPGQRIQ